MIGDLQPGDMVLRHATDEDWNTYTISRASIEMDAC